MFESLVRNYPAISNFPIHSYTIDITFLFSIVCSAVCCCCIIVVVIVVVVVDDDDVFAVVAVVKMTSLYLTWFSLAINTNNHYYSK